MCRMGLWLGIFLLSVEVGALPNLVFGNSSSMEIPHFRLPVLFVTYLYPNNLNLDGVSASKTERNLIFVKSFGGRRKSPDKVLRDRMRAQGIEPLSAERTRELLEILVEQEKIVDPIIERIKPSKSEDERRWREWREKLGLANEQSRRGWLSSHIDPKNQVLGVRNYPMIDNFYPWEFSKRRLSMDQFLRARGRTLMRNYSKRPFVFTRVNNIQKDLKQKSILWQKVKQLLYSTSSY